VDDVCGIGEKVFFFFPLQTRMGSSNCFRSVRVWYDRRVLCLGGTSVTAVLVLARWMLDMDCDMMGRLPLSERYCGRQG